MARVAFTRYRFEGYSTNWGCSEATRPPESLESLPSSSPFLLALEVAWTSTAWDGMVIIRSMADNSDFSQFASLANSITVARHIAVSSG